MVCFRPIPHLNAASVSVRPRRWLVLSDDQTRDGIDDLMFGLGRDVGVWDVACAMAAAAVDASFALLACGSGHALNASKTLCRVAKKNPRRRQGLRNSCRGVTLFPLPAAVFPHT